jgi:hypothetical protein
VAVQSHGRTLESGLVGGGQRAREVELDAAAPLFRKSRERLEQVNVRPREQVDSGDRTAESAPDAPAAPVGEAEIVGWLQPSDETTAPDPDPADDVLPALRVSDALQRLDVDLYGGYAVVVADEPGVTQGTNAGTDGLAPGRPEELPEASRFTALRNLLYGLEWWVFGAFAAFVWWRYVRDQPAEQPGEQPTEPTEEAAEPPAGESHQDAVRSEP